MNSHAVLKKILASAALAGLAAGIGAFLELPVVWGVAARRGAALKA